jgi:hypothetical protein
VINKTAPSEHTDPVPINNALFILSSFHTFITDRNSILFYCSLSFLNLFTFYHTWYSSLHRMELIITPRGIQILHRGIYFLERPLL